MFVKICGITNESDALMATAMGTDAVGFVFAPSSRRIQPTQARDIARRLPPEILTIGVFRDETPQRVVEVVNAAGLRGVQLHGFESAGEVAWVRKRVPFVIKAFGVGHPLLDRIDDYEVDAVMLDGDRPGSGEPYDLSVAAELARRYRLILAGGLRNDTVAAAIDAVHPWGVDVSSGVESAPGHKDVRLTRRFINAAHAYGDGPEPGEMLFGGPLGGPVPASEAEGRWDRPDPGAEGPDGASRESAQGSLYDWDDDISR